MSFVLFKAGDYGNKGKWSNEMLSGLVNNKNELDIIPYHTSEFTKLGMLRNEIPVIGKFKNIAVKDDEIIADNVEIFDRKEFKNRKVDRLSVEIENGEITRVGALPVGVEPAVSNSGSISEFSQEYEMDWINQKEIIEFSNNKNNSEGSEEMNLEELLEKLEGLDGADKIKAVNSLIKTLTSEEVDKIEVPEKKEKEKSEDEIREEVKNEFAREAQIKEFMSKNVNKITPAMKKIGFEEFVKQVFSNNNGIIEFSENGNSHTAKSYEILDKIFENLPSFGGNKPLEFGNDNDEISRQQKLVNDEIAQYKARNNIG